MKTFKEKFKNSCLCKKCLQSRKSFVLSVALPQSCSNGDRSVVNEFEKTSTGDKTDLLKTEPFNYCGGISGENVHKAMKVGANGSPEK